MIRQSKPASVPAEQDSDNPCKRPLTEQQFNDLHATPLGDHIEDMLVACLDACLVGFEMSPVETALHLSSAGIADVDYSLPFDLLIHYAFAYERALKRRERSAKYQRYNKKACVGAQDSLK